MTTLRVRFNELDPYGHVNHAVYLTYFEQARTELLEDRGVGLDYLATRGYQLVVVDMHVRFVQPAVAGDVLNVSTSIVRLRAASSHWNQRLFRGDTLLAVNQLRSAVTTLDGRPTRGPDELWDALVDLVIPGE